ncbi:MAG: hypothetical protein H7256_09395 [Bdellovibrio sp.]|nr:hypothetical protein [Bdellovibrio sp.]
MDNKFEEAADQIKKTFENFDTEEEIQAIQQTAKEAADVATDFIRKYPIQSVLGAAVIGFLLASVMKKK